MSSLKGEDSEAQYKWLNKVYRISSQQSTDSSAASTPRSCLQVEGKQLSGSHPGASAFWARGPEPTSAISHLRMKSGILLPHCCLCYQPHVCLQLRPRPALHPKHGPTSRTAHQGWPDHQRCTITLHSVSSACVLSPSLLTCLKLSALQGSGLPHTLPKTLSNYLRLKWSLPPQNTRTLISQATHTLLIICCLVLSVWYLLSKSLDCLEGRGHLLFIIVFTTLLSLRPRTKQVFYKCWLIYCTWKWKWLPCFYGNPRKESNFSETQEINWGNTFRALERKIIWSTCNHMHKTVYDLLK